MMGLKLAFSLHHPKRAQELAEINLNQDDETPLQAIKEKLTSEPEQKRMKAMKAPSASNQLETSAPKPNDAEPLLHALDPGNQNMLSLDTALVPYQPNEKIQQDDTNQDFNFDLL